MYCRVLACDYDGTTAVNGKLVPEVAAALRAARAQGLVTLLVTGRVLPDLHAAQVDWTAFDAVVAENGAIVWLPGRDRTFHLGSPPPAHFLGELRARGVPFHAGAVVLGTADRHAGELLDVVRRLGIDGQLAFNREALMLLPTGVDKAAGVRRALEELGRSERNLIAFGDAENDLPLLALAEVGVAARGAVPSVAAAADERLSHPGGAGVAHYIEALLTRDAVAPTPPRRQIVLGHDDRGPVTLPGSGTSVMISGDARTGKSWLAGLVAEQLLDAGYRLSVLDPEGDHLCLGRRPRVLVLCHDLPLPAPAAVPPLLAEKGLSVVLSVAPLPQQEKLAYARELLDAIAPVQTASGVPHWIVVDEAHYFFHQGAPSCRHASTRACRRTSSCARRSTKSGTSSRRCCAAGIPPAWPRMPCCGGSAARTWAFCAATAMRPAGRSSPPKPASPRRRTTDASMPTSRYRPTRPSASSTPTAQPRRSHAASPSSTPPSAGCRRPRCAITSPPAISLAGRPMSSETGRSRRGCASSKRPRAPAAPRTARRSSRTSPTATSFRSPDRARRTAARSRRGSWPSPRARDRGARAAAASRAGTPRPSAGSRSRTARSRPRGSPPQTGSPPRPPRSSPRAARGRRTRAGAGGSRGRGGPASRRARPGARRSTAPSPPLTRRARRAAAGGARRRRPARAPSWPPSCRRESSRRGPGGSSRSARRRGAGDGCRGRRARRAASRGARPRTRTARDRDDRACGCAARPGSWWRRARGALPPPGAPPTRRHPRSARARRRRAAARRACSRPRASGCRGGQIRSRRRRR